MTARPLYHSFAWAYDVVVARPGGPPAEALASALTGRRVAAGARLLDAGCGSGRYAADLGKAGFRVTGLDRSAELVAVANGRAGAARFEVGDLRDFAPSEPFDAAVCRGVLNDLLTDEDRHAAVAGLRRALHPGGLLIADVRDWDASVEHYRDRPVFERLVETERGPLRFRSETSLDPDHHTLRIHEWIAVDGRGEEFDFAMRCWTPEELAQTLAAAGFAEVEVPAPDPELRRARADRIVAVAAA